MTFNATDLIVVRDAQDRIIVRTRSPELRQAIEAWASAGTGRKNDDPWFYAHTADEPDATVGAPDYELSEWTLTDAMAARLWTLLHTHTGPDLVRRFYPDAEELRAAQIVASALNGIIIWGAR